MAKETLSAHELNKYTYCPYQWYYEKIYGRAELRRLHQEYMESLGLEDSTIANFIRGENFHKNLYRQYRLRRLLWKVTFLALLILILVFWVMQYVHI